MNDFITRFYSPLLGRFTQPDSIIPSLSNSQAWNRYAYAYNNPLNYTDPSGHVPCLDGNCGSGVYDSFLHDFSYYNRGSSPCQDGMCYQESSGQPGGIDLLNGVTNLQRVSGELCETCHELPDSRERVVNHLGWFPGETVDLPNDITSYDYQELGNPQWNPAQAGIDVVWVANAMGLVNDFLRYSKRKKSQNLWD